MNRQPNANCGKMADRGGLKGQAMESLDNIIPRVRLSFSSLEESGESEVVFGHGVAQLCQGVKDMGSLNRAAKSMGMAYSKAWRIMKDTENALGIKILNRDGAHGSTLTEQGRELLDAYYEVEKAVQTAAEHLLGEIIAR